MYAKLLLKVEGRNILCFSNTSFWKQIFIVGNIKTAFPKPTFTYKLALFLELIINKSFITEFQKQSPKVFHTDTIYFIYL